LRLLPIPVTAMEFARAAGTGLIRLPGLRRAVPQAGERPYNSLAETLGALIAGCDSSGSVTSVSPNCEAVVGVPPCQLIGRGFFNRVLMADRPDFLKAISDARAGSNPAAATLRWRGAAQAGRCVSAGPGFLWLEMRLRRRADLPALADGTEGDELIAIIRDVTEAKRREAELERARTEAAEANRGKEYFLAQATHELRTPLNAIVGFSELLRDPKLSPLDHERQREYTSIIHQSGLHLLAVVNSILGVPEVQSDFLDAAPEPFAVAPLIDLCCDMMKLRAKNNGVELLRAYPKNLDEITAGKRAFAQILINLLSNAIKFTPAGGSVTICARPGPHSLSILVSDTGIGIAAPDLARLGNPFFQAKGPPVHQDKGTGLGLSIVCGLVGSQGGTISVASEPDKGTSVHVRLPLDCRGLTPKGNTPAKIETITRLPIYEPHDPYQQMMVQKIA